MKTCLIQGRYWDIVWDKTEDTLEIQIHKATEERPLTKKTILSRLGRIYDPLGIISPTMVEGKRIYRDACDEDKGWNEEVSPALTRDWEKWMKQLQNVKIPRSLVTDSSKINAVDIHQFADESGLACSTTAIAVIERGTLNVRGLLTSKSRISKRSTWICRLELISGHMAANLAKNLCRPERMANKIRYSVDGQHGCLVLDCEPRKVLESLRRQPSQKDSSDYRRSRHSMEILPHRKKPS